MVTVCPFFQRRTADKCVPDISILYLNDFAILPSRLHKLYKHLRSLQITGGRVNFGISLSQHKQYMQSPAA